MHLHLHVRVDGEQCLAGGVDLRHAHPLDVVQELTLQVAGIDHIVVDHPDRPDTCGRQVHGSRGPQPAGANYQDLGVEQFQLSGLSDLGQADMAGIPGALFPGETGGASPGMAFLLPALEAAGQ